MNWMGCYVAWLEFLILFPLIPALLCLVLKPGAVRDWLVRLSAAVLAFAALVVAGAVWADKSGVSIYTVEIPGLKWIQLTLEWVLYGFLFWRSLSMRGPKRVIPWLILAQLAAVTWFEAGDALPEAHSLLAIDHLSALLIAIVGVVGGLVAVYALPYMKEYQEHHHDIPDRRGVFFFLIFLFLSAMNGILLGNGLTLVLFFWELTTACSYLLIRYSGHPDAIENSDLALALNVVGGVLFTAGLGTIALHWAPATGEVLGLLNLGHGALLPAILLGAAGVVKAAQAPFHKWLLGAMVAPTPVSGLLHSSTMVKAGVFLLLRLAPIYTHTLAGGLLAGVGAASFLGCSLLAVTESNAKRVLAYSTIANLGLIVACAGVGTSEALWAGMMLLLYHALSKALLFLAVGSAEHRLGSRDIEDMEGLLLRHPLLGGVMMTGILGMFLAPFGMLVAKWKVLQAFADHAPLLAVVVAFGSAPTLFFWTKWMGKLVAVPRLRPERGGAGGGAWVLVLLAILSVAAAAAAPWISSWAVEPELLRIYGSAPGFKAPELLVLLALGAGLMALPLFFMLFPGTLPASAPYLGGANMGEGFTNSFHQVQETRLRNYYLHDVLRPRSLGAALGVVGAALLIAAIAAGGF